MLWWGCGLGLVGDRAFVFKPESTGRPLRVGEPLEAVGHVFV